MAKYERRNSVALDDAYFYCRHLERGARPSLYKVCNAISTLDLALTNNVEERPSVHICNEAWSRIRDSLFNILVSSFAGYFIVYAEGEAFPLEPGTDWPRRGTLEFYPSDSQRKRDSYTANLDKISEQVLTPLRWCFAEGRQTVTPSDFSPEQVNPEESTETAEPAMSEAHALLHRLYEVCEEEASRGKKKAHRRWWQLYWEANSCADRRQKHQLQKQMSQLQSIWGRPG